MRKNSLLLIVFFLVFSFSKSYSCTSVAVSKGASVDGSVMISWTYDVAGYAAPLQFYPGGEYEDGDSLDIYSFREKKFLGRIAQVNRTYKVVGNMNEHQLAIAETTFTGRPELHGGEGVLDYGNLIYITLQRAKTAREAIKIMDELAKKYGYIDTGETFSIGDKEEVWVMDWVGRGEYEKGALWVAARVPDGKIAAHANQARIRNIDWNDTKNWMWSEDIVEFAKEREWFEGSKEDFSFVDVFDPVTPTSLLLCESRVWSIYNRAAPSKEFSADYWRCVKGAEPYPLFITPDKKLGVQDMINFHRDHFHNTPYYTADGIAAGPYKNPYRWRPVFFELEGDDMEYAWERPVSQPQTAFSFISQARSRYPDSFGGICWYSVDDTYLNVWMPLYIGMNKVPPSLEKASPIEFDWESAYWVFSLVANYTYGLFDPIIPVIKKEQKRLESRALTMVPAIDAAAVGLYESGSKELLEDFLTDFSFNNAEYVAKKWRELGEYIFVKFNDRYKRTEMEIDAWPAPIGYPEDYKRRAVEERPGYFDVRWREPNEKID